jgi:hypothetical protein
MNMAYRMGPMSILRVKDPAKFSAKLQAALKRHDGVLAHVALEFDVGINSVKRWVYNDKTLKKAMEKSRKLAA